MAERLDLFRDGGLSLGVLIADLEFLLGEVKAVDVATHQELRRHWEVLEEVYAVALGMHDGKLDLQSENLVRESVAALRARVAALLVAATPEPQDSE